MDADIDLSAALTHACAQRGIDSSDVRLIHHYSNAVYLLPRADAVARVTTGASAAYRIPRIARVARWLVEERGFAATAPLSDVEPVIVGDATVSFWVYYAPAKDEPPLTSAPTPTSRPLRGSARCR